MVQTSDPRETKKKEKIRTGKPQIGNACCVVKSFKSRFLATPQNREVQGHKPVKIHAKKKSVQLHPRECPSDCQMTRMRVKNVEKQLSVTITMANRTMGVCAVQQTDLVSQRY